MSLALLPDAPFMLKELVDLVASNTSENKDCERATKLLRDLSNTKFGIYQLPNQNQSGIFNLSGSFDGT